MSIEEIIIKKINENLLWDPLKEEIEYKKEFAEELIEEVIKPLCEKAFEEGSQDTVSQYAKYRTHDLDRHDEALNQWLTNNLK
jgi:hypothetical protein